MNSTSSENGSDAILKWLSTQGYPLELKVAAALRANGWHVEHAAWYADPDTGKMREIDLLATIWQTAQDGKQVASIVLAIECKMSKGKPWITFAPSLASQGVTDFSFVDGFSHDVWMACTTDGLDLPAIVKVRDRVSHGIVRAHAENKGGEPTAPFAAIQGAMAAAFALGRKQAELACSANAWDTAVIHVPLIVVEGQLFEYALVDDQEVLTEVARAAVRTASKGWFGSAAIRIVTYAGLRSFLEENTSEAREFLAEIAPMARGAVTSLKSRIAAVGRDSALGTS